MLFTDLVYFIVRTHKLLLHAARPWFTGALSLITAQLLGKSILRSLLKRIRVMTSHSAKSNTESSSKAPHEQVAEPEKHQVCENAQNI